MSSVHETIEGWIARDAIEFSIDSPASTNAAVDRLVASLDESVELLGFGEALHGCEEMLTLRNQIFTRLVEQHGYTAIAIESSFPRGRIVDDYVNGTGASAFAEIAEAGFSHAFGRLEANRELIEWMRNYNASHPTKIQFYGFDSPTEMMNTDSPRILLEFALDYLDAFDRKDVENRRARFVELLGNDADWENPAAMFDPGKSVGLSENARALRIETEDLIVRLQIRRPEIAQRVDSPRYLEALRHATAARQLLAYHAGVARPSPTRTSDLLGLRDLMMADNLMYALSHQRALHGQRSKVFAFAHNHHLKRGVAHWQLGADALSWWPAGAQLNAMIGSRYAVIGSGIGVAENYDVTAPEPASLEAKLLARASSALFIPTYNGKAIPASAQTALALRAGSAKNPSYFPFMPQSFTDFDWLGIVKSTSIARALTSTV